MKIGHLFLKFENLVSFEDLVKCWYIFPFKRFEMKLTISRRIYDGVLILYIYLSAMRS